LVEEIAYRGIAFDCASSIAGPPLAIVSQAVADAAILTLVLVMA
jgi:hypothetical protein